VSTESTGNDLQAEVRQLSDRLASVEAEVRRLSALVAGPGLTPQDTETAVQHAIGEAMESPRGQETLERAVAPHVERAVEAANEATEARSKVEEALAQVGTRVHRATQPIETAPDVADALAKLDEADELLASSKADIAMSEARLHHVRGESAGRE